MRGLRLERMGMDWRMALVRNTMLESRRNCRKMHFGKKVIAVYLAVKTQLLLRVPSTVPSRIVRSEVVYFAISVPILFRTSF